MCLFRQIILHYAAEILLLRLTRKMKNKFKVTSKSALKCGGMIKLDILMRSKYDVVPIAIVGCHDTQPVVTIILRERGSFTGVCFVNSVFERALQVSSTKYAVAYI